MTQFKHVAGVMTQSVQISFDPTESSATNVRIGTSSSSGETHSLVLPAGAIPISIMTIGGATLAGGTNPTVDIGTSADDDLACSTK